MTAEHDADRPGGVPGGDSPGGRRAEVDPDVSRETARLRDRYAGVSGIERFAEILASDGVDRGLIGPREVPRLWPRHIANCAVVVEEALADIPGGARIADVGSGAGLPGIVWALLRPDLHVTLIEPLLRRTTFLTETVGALGLGDRVTVVRARAEHVAPAEFDIVTARAVAPLDRLVGWTLPLTRVGGRLLALKGSTAKDEMDRARPVIRALGGGDPVLMRFGVELLDPPTSVVVVTRTQVRPRRTGRKSVI